MDPREPVCLAWSGGKDCALALDALRESAAYRVTHLLTTLSEEYGRVTMHGIHRDILHEQAACLGLPVVEVAIPSPCPMEEYGKRMGAAMERMKAVGMTRMVYGDLYLQDIRAYREEKLAEIGMTGLFPIWGRDREALAKDFIEAGFQAHIACVDTEQLDPGFVGRPFDFEFLQDLPAEVDPCGENGEFHTFVWDGPVFHRPVPHRIGHVEDRGRFHFCEFLPE